MTAVLSMSPFTFLPAPCPTETNDTNPTSCLYWPPEPYHPTDPEAPEDVRKRDLLYSDPVHQINLVAFVRDHVQQAVQASGGEQRFQEEWLGRVDADVLKGFGALGIM